MKQLTIKDNELRSKEDFSDIPEIVRAVSDKTLKQLDKDGIFVFPNILIEAQDLKEEQMVLQSINDSIRSSNVMGFLGCGSERLVIESRFSTGGKDFFFQYLLEKVLDFPNTVNLETDASSNDRMFMLLLFLFPVYLKAAMRKGPFKTYVRNEYNDENVRGKIDIDRHIKKNVPFIGKIAYSQREYTFDNYLMHLVRHTIEFIKKKPIGATLLAKVKDEVKLVVSATAGYESKDMRRIILENKKITVRHAYYSEYRALQRLCLLILQNERHQVGAGSKKIFGILFDGAWLWEEYVSMLVGNWFHHPQNKAGMGTQWLFRESGNLTGKIYPDFIGKNVAERIIADAKYKPDDNIGNKDYLQVLAYMFRFDAKKAYYFYPEKGETTDKTFWLNSGSSYEGNVTMRNDICIIKHGLIIPVNAQAYDEFSSMIGKSEKEFCSAFNEVVNV